MTLPLGKTLKTQNRMSRPQQCGVKVRFSAYKKDEGLKRYGNLYEKICSMENLELALKNAKKGKGWYRIFLNYTLLRKTTCIDFKRKMTKIRTKVESGVDMNYSEWCSINSYKGWLKYCDSYRLSEKYILPIQPYADRYYENHIKKKGGKSMKEYQKVRSTVKPEPTVIDEFSVWVAANITEVKEATGDAETGFEGYEYDLTQYDKDEYIQMINDKNVSLEAEITSTQEALCDVYELLG